MADTLFTPTEVTADLAILDKLLHQVGVEWELYFAGRADGKRMFPPSRRLAEIEAIIQYYTKTPPHRTAERFRFNTMVHRYRTSQERVNRRLRQLEEMGIGLKASANKSLKADDISKPQILAATRTTGGAPTGDQLRDIFQAFRNARRARGLSVSDLNYREFADKLASRLQQAREQVPGRDFELRVDEVGGNVRVAVRPVASSTPPSSSRGSAQGE